MAEIRFSDRMRERLTLSFEVFPPKTEKGMQNLPSVLDELLEFHPDYISCTSVHTFYLHRRNKGSGQGAAAELSG